MDKLINLWEGIKTILSFEIFGSNTMHVSIGTILTIVFSLVVVTYFIKLVFKLVGLKLDQEDRDKFVSILGFVKYFVNILVVMAILHSSGVNLTVLVTASAALFVGLGFALQYLFQDLISGILIIFDKSLQVGDILEAEGKVGRVFEIRLRTTRILTRDDKVLIVPNHKFLTSSIYNYTQNHKTTREQIFVSVAYGSDTNNVRQVLEEVAYKHNEVMKIPKPLVLFEDFGDSGLKFSLNFYLQNSYDSLNIQSDLRFKIDFRFREEGITIPFPQRDVHLFNSKV